MKTNMGVADRIPRILVAVLMGVLYWAGIINGTVAIGLRLSTLPLNISNER